MWHILSFEIVQKKKGLFLVWPLGELFFAFQLSLICFELSFLVLQFCISKSVFDTLIHFILTLIILDILCKNKPLKSRNIAYSKKISASNIFGGFSTFCSINRYGFECFRCVFHELLCRIYLTLLPSSSAFTKQTFIVHNPCTW